MRSWILLALLVALSLVPAADARLEQSKLQVALLANSVDLALADTLILGMEGPAVEVIPTDAKGFDSQKGRKVVIVLGGPDAYEGVGEIVSKLLSQEEQRYIRSAGARMAYSRKDVWRKGQQVFIFSGSNRNDTRRAHMEAMDAVMGSIRELTPDVVIENNSFNPRVIRVDLGTTVAWRNRDRASHTVTSPKHFDSGAIGGKVTSGISIPRMEGVWYYWFQEPGVYEYHCQYHGEMKGTVIVENVTASTSP